ncbi:MAG: hypothetical protein WC848_02520 [Parcubacteria group bacterium]|jgi:hypothetical protein
MKPWFLENPTLLDELKILIDLKYATLNTSIENAVVYIRGTLFIKSLEGKELGRYKIEIIIPDDYPNSAPILRETGDKFNKVADRHFNAIDNTACLFFRDAKYKYFPKGSSIVDFIEGPIKNFFLWQIDYDLNGGKSSLGGLDHGTFGLIQFYKEELGVNDEESVFRFLVLFDSKVVPRAKKCFCGSGSLLKDCHIQKFRALKQSIPRKDAKKSLNELRDYMDRMQSLKQKYGKEAVDGAVKQIRG